MQFRTKSQQSSITLIFLGSLSLTLPLVGLYLYPYWTGKLDSKFFFFFEKKTNKAVFLPRLKFCGNLLKQKFPSFSLVTRTLFSTKVYQRHIRQDLRSAWDHETNHFHGISREVLVTFRPDLTGVPTKGFIVKWGNVHKICLHTLVSGSC